MIKSDCSLQQSVFASTSEEPSDAASRAKTAPLDPAEAIVWNGSSKKRVTSQRSVSSSKRSITPVNAVIKSTTRGL